MILKVLFFICVIELSSGNDSSSPKRSKQQKKTSGFFDAQLKNCSSASDEINHPCGSHNTTTFARVSKKSVRTKRQFNQNFFPGSNSINIDCSLGLGGCPNFQFDYGQISNAVIREAVNQGLGFMTKMSRAKQGMKTIPRRRSPELSHARFLGQAYGVPEMERMAFIGMYTAQQLMLTMDIDQSQFSKMNFAKANMGGTLMERDCPRRPVCNVQSRFRTLDGSCNNLANTKLGMAQTPLRRVMHNHYDDGMGLPRTRSRSGENLLQTRLISNMCAANYDDDDSRFTSLVVAFGQFLDHDLDHVPVVLNEENEPLNCCANTSRLSVEQRMLCFPIIIPPNDPVFKGQRPCINIPRSVAAPGVDCQPGPMEQINQITHWLDSSNVYGSSLNVSRDVRAFRDGLLKTVRCSASDQTECLPYGPMNDCGGSTTRCGLAGDLRVNEQPTLGVMHMLFMREHNRLARGLKVVNPHWEDERLFQEARRILNAEWLHLTYSEYLPVHLGEKPEFKPLVGVHSYNYDGHLDARVSNEFAAAAFRMGHTFISGIMNVYSLATAQLEKTMTLTEVFGNADLLRENNMFDSLLKGLTIQPCQRFDNTFANSVKNELFADNTFGIDLIATNMQRGRDHGLPGYVHYRRLCNVGDAKSFKDLNSNIRPEKILLLSKAYQHVDDIDLFIGGVMEEPCPGAFIGCTFACILTDVFDRLRRGDRFFYDLGGQPSSFSLPQLNEIRRVSMARLLCDNSRIKTVSPNAFLQPDTFSNSPVSCQSIPKVDLSLFAEQHEFEVGINVRNQGIDNQGLESGSVFDQADVLLKQADNIFQNIFGG